MQPETQVQRASDAIANLREKTGEFYRLRAQSNKFLTGKLVAKNKQGQVIPVQEVCRIAIAFRDPAKEQETFRELVQLYGLVLGHEPRPDELRQPLPQDEALGFVWLPVVGLAAVIGGAASLTQAFGYLAERERRLQLELGAEPRQTMGDKIAAVSSWLIPATAVVGVGVAGWYGYNKLKKKEE